MHGFTCAARAVCKAVHSRCADDAGRQGGTSGGRGTHPAAGMPPKGLGRADPPPMRHEEKGQTSVGGTRTVHSQKVQSEGDLRHVSSTETS